MKHDLRIENTSPRAIDSERMKWSWKLGSFAGIDVFVHATFLLLVGWVMLTHWLHGRSLEAMLSGTGFILALFACVLAHEYGHALMARRYGIGTRDITLLPIGGLARLERMPSDPKQELLVALAGPAVNVVIAVALFGWLSLGNSLGPWSGLGVASGSLMERLLVANVFLAAFNMLPAFPMDGGRVLRALMASRMDYAKATRKAATVGQGMAILFGLAGLFSNPFLVFIALFVWLGAAQEADAVEARTALSGVPVSRAMVTDFRTLAPGDPLSRAVDYLLSGSQQDFPVVERGLVVGVLAKVELVGALARLGSRAAVGDVMLRRFETAEVAESLDSVLERLRQCECHVVPVTHNGVLAGLLTMENAAEFMLVQSALRSPATSRARAA